jgi:hypothetical protein
MKARKERKNERRDITEKKEKQNGKQTCHFFGETTISNVWIYP